MMDTVVGGRDVGYAIDVLHPLAAKPSLLAGAHSRDVEQVIYQAGL